MTAPHRAQASTHRWVGRHPGGTPADPHPDAPGHRRDYARHDNARHDHGRHDHARHDHARHTLRPFGIVIVGSARRPGG
jgi:hypothetical protein